MTPHVNNFSRLRLSTEKQQGKRKYESDGGVMVGDFVCMYVCACTVECECECECEGGQAGGGEGEGRSGYSTKNKNPTRQCGES